MPQTTKTLMKNVALTLVILFIALSSPSGTITNILFGNAQSYNLIGRTNMTIELDLLAPLNRVIDGNPISNDPRNTITDANGNFAFTNVQFGNYSLAYHDSRGSRFPVVVGTNNLGNLPIAGLFNNNQVPPPNPNTNYYTQAQVDALIIGATKRITFDSASITFDQP
jgi:hypothetical protein